MDLGTIQSLVDSAKVQALEDNISNFILDSSHIYLYIGLVCIIAFLRYLDPLKPILFTESRKWLIAPINVALSAIGVFLLGLTPATTLGMKIIVALIISTCVTFTWEAALKRIINFVMAYIEKRKNGNGAEAPASTSAEPPANKPV